MARGERFCDDVRAATNGGADALFDTALLGRDGFPGIRDGGAYVPVRGWDKTPVERGIRVLSVFADALRAMEAGGLRGRAVIVF